MLRRGADSTAGAARHLSGSITWNIVNLVRQHGGEDAVARFVAASDTGRTIDELEDVATWVSFSEGKALFAAATEVLDDPRALRHVGAAIARQDMTSEVVELLRSLGSPGELLRHIDQVVPKFCTVIDMRAVAVEAGHAVIEGHSVDGFPRFDLLCDFTAGLLEQSSMPFDLPPASVTEEECESRGDARCLFRVAWQSQPAPDVAAPNHDAEVAVIASRFETFQQTAADLVAVEDVESVLAAITSRAGLAVRAPRHLLVVAPHAGRPLSVHHQGCTAEELDRLVADVMEDVPDEHDGARLIVDVASVRRHYGRLAAIFDEGVRFFPAERTILAGYARLAAAALDTATALEESRQQAATAEALLDLARALAGIGHRRELAGRLAASVPAVTGCDASVVALWNSDRQCLEVVGAHGFAAEAEHVMRRLTISRNETPAVDRLKSNRAPGFVDVDTEDDFLAGVLRMVGMNWSGVAPIVAGDELIGIVNALFAAPPAPGDREPSGHLMARLRGLADIAATALQNSVLVEHMRHQALFDEITGLPNRRLLEDRVEQALAHGRRTGGGFTLMFVDLDRFKNVNDTLGHSAGDELLRQVGARFRAAMRQEDTVARLGGDEFALLLPRVETAELAAALADRLYDSLQDPFSLYGHTVFMTSSIGIASSPADGVDYGTLMKYADMAMYGAKEQGRNRYAFYSSALHGNLTERLRLESDLHLALERDELVLEYQPQVSLVTGGMVAVEALVRWRHPELGRLTPDQFLPLATESGLIVDVDAWVLKEACRQAGVWRREGLDVRVAINVGDRDLRDAALAGRVADAIARNGLSPAQVELEVTEQVVDHGTDRLLDSLGQLKALGVMVAIDDFGTGNSGLSRLRRLPIDTLKIEKSFVQEIAGPADRAPLLAAMVSLSHDLGLAVVAEGVETPQQAAFLRSRRCDLAQGYLFSPAVAAEEVPALMRGGAVSPPQS